jgi:hypothetical protein
MNRLRRDPAETIDALNRSMLLQDHHDWLPEAANRLVIGTDILWQAACASWARNCAEAQILESIATPVREALEA